MPLRPHQKSLVKKLEYSRGALLFHDLGSGKTRSAIELVLKWNEISESSMNVLIVTKHKLLGNFFQEIDKMNQEKKIDKSKFRSITFETLARRSNDEKTTDVLIVDECQYVNNSETKRYQAVFELAKKVQKVILLSATPMKNHPWELACILNIILAHPNRPIHEKRNLSRIQTIGLNPDVMPYLPMTKKLWELRHGENSQLNRQYLIPYFRTFVSLYREDKTSEEYQRNFPKMKIQDILLPMTKEHYSEYLKVEKENRPIINKNEESPEEILNRGAQFSDFTNLQFLAYICKLRMACNRLQVLNNGKEIDDHFPKIRYALKRIGKNYIKDPKYKAVVYSNFLGCGVLLVKTALNIAKIPYAMITGDTKDVENQVEQYVTGKKRIILISTAGNEGLNLTGTWEFFSLDPHWNIGSFEQAVGRVCRFGMNRGLTDPEITIIRLFTTKPDEKAKIETADMYLKKLGTNKNDNICSMIQFIEEANCIEKCPKHQLLSYIDGMQNGLNRKKRKASSSPPTDYVLNQKKIKICQ